MRYKAFRGILHNDLRSGMRITRTRKASCESFQLAPYSASALTLTLPLLDLPTFLTVKAVTIDVGLIRECVTALL